MALDKTSVCLLNRAHVVHDLATTRLTQLDRLLSQSGSIFDPTSRGKRLAQAGARATTSMQPISL